MSLVLYHAVGSCGFAPLVALEAVGAEYELRRLDLARGDQRDPRYIACNPHGRVPTLVADGVPISEVIAVLTYIAARFPQARLLPTAALELGKAMEVMSWIASSVHVRRGGQALGRGPRYEARCMAGVRCAYCQDTGAARGAARPGERRGNPPLLWRLRSFRNTSARTTASPIRSKSFDMSSLSHIDSMATRPDLSSSALMALTGDLAARAEEFDRSALFPRENFDILADAGALNPCGRCSRAG